MKLRVGDVVEHGSPVERFVVNRLTVTKGRLQIDAIEIDEARRRHRELGALLELAGVDPE